MSPHTDGKKGTCRNDILYTVETREGRGKNRATMNTQGIHVHVDDRRPLIVQAYQHWLQACTGTGV